MKIINDAKMKSIQNKTWHNKRRKTTSLKYEPPYSKKPSTKGYGVAASTANHHSVEEVSLDGSSKLVYANQQGFARDKSIHGRRYTSGGDEEQTHAEKGILKKHGYGLVHGEQLRDKWVDDGQSDNLELIAQQDSLLGAVGGTSASEVERTLKSLNGYHEDILEALRSAASHRGTGTGNTPVGSGSLSEEMLRKTLQECTNAQLSFSSDPYKRASGSKGSSRENVCDPNQSHTVLIEGGLAGASHASALLHHHRSQHQLHQTLPPPTHSSQQAVNDDDDAPSTGPLRIRNIEDLIRQLEHHSSRHMGPSVNDDVRGSDADPNHYRLDSSTACSESSQGRSNQQLSQSQKTATIHASYNSRCRPRSEEESRFSYGRYRHPTTISRHQPHPSHSPHAFGHHTHHSHAHGHGSHGPHSSHHSSHTHLHQDDDAIYDTTDHHERSIVESRLDPRETPDSESDAFIQAQQQLARWASEDVVSVVVLDQTSAPGTMSDSQQSGVVGSMSASLPGPALGTTTTSVIHQHQHQHQHHGDHSSAATAAASAAAAAAAAAMASTATTSAASAASGSAAAATPMGLAVPNGINVSQRDYYPSPPSTETESSGSVIQTLSRSRLPMQQDTSQQLQQLHSPHPHPHQQQLQMHQLQFHQQQQSGDTTSSSNNSQSGQIMENGRYPEYKH